MEFELLIAGVSVCICVIYAEFASDYFVFPSTVVLKHLHFGIHDSF